MIPIQGPGPGGLAVLVADDNETLRLAISAMLRVLGHRVDCVGDGLEAVRAACERAYDVVFLDVQMPEMGGIEAAAWLRRSPPRGACPRLVGMSGDAGEREQARVAGMDDFLAKPILARDVARVLVGHDADRPG